MSKIWYFPLEPYKERYTTQLHGWMQKGLAKLNNIAVRTVLGEDYAEENRITTGQVLDARKRVRWATSQVNRFIDALAAGEVSRYDRLLFMDFFHPGMDGLLYALHQYDRRDVAISAYCWAQSMDQWDFTHPMRDWMRPLEKAYANRFDDVFVADAGLGELFLAATDHKPAVVGLPFDSEDVARTLLPNKPIDWSVEGPRKENMVLFTSRFDWEKNPAFFVQVAKRYREKFGPYSAEFYMLTSADDLRSNSGDVERIVNEAHQDNVVTVVTGLTKRRYYEFLSEAKVQFNCAFQDWVSFTLLEAVTFGCYPVYLMYRSFPKALNYDTRYLYAPWDVDSAVDKVRAALTDESEFSESAITRRQEAIVGPHDRTIENIIKAIQY